MGKTTYTINADYEHGDFRLYAPASPRLIKALKTCDCSRAVKYDAANGFWQIEPGWIPDVIRACRLVGARIRYREGPL